MNEIGPNYQNKEENLKETKEKKRRVIFNVLQAKRSYERLCIVGFILYHLKFVSTGVR